jgi:hypothetical protein
MESENCKDCKKKAALFTAAGVAFGLGLGFLTFKLVSRGR